MAAAVPFCGYAAYAPSKAACKSFMDVLRNEFADTGIKLHIAFPPDIDTPGFANENKTKPYETAHMFPECFNDLYPAKDVADSILRGIKQGYYFVSSPDAVGDLIVSRAWGHYPRRCAIFEACVAPLFVGIQSMMVWWTDGVVRKRAHHRKRLESSTSTDINELDEDITPLAS